MKCEMTIEYLLCRADLNFEVDFGVNDCTNVRLYSDNASLSSIKINKKNLAFPFKNIQ